MKKLTKEERLARLNESLDKKWKQIIHCNTFTDIGYLRLQLLEAQARDIQAEIDLVENGGVKEIEKT